MHDHHHAGGRHEQHRHTADGVEVPVGEVIPAGELAPDVDATHIVWIDASQGASGDMLLAALLDAGADAGSVAKVLELVAPGKLHLQQRTVERGPFRAHKVDVMADEQNPPARHLSDVEQLLANPEIPHYTRDLATTAFRELARAEAAVHGMDIESVHFHEVGALDSIGDIVGVCEAFRTLGIARASSSVVALGDGVVKTQHGLLSVPPPAVAELAKGWQVEAGGPPEAGELCTPTGLVLIRTLCDEVSALPPMTTTSIGIGAGNRVRKDRAGVLRVVLGSPIAATPAPAEALTVCEVSANLDDMDPRLLPGVITEALAAGALDAWLSPIVMKKGRPGHTLTILCTPEESHQMGNLLLASTTTLGVRISAPMTRLVLQRALVPVQVDGQVVHIKVAGDGQTITKLNPEFDDLAALSSSPLTAVDQIRTAAREAGLFPGAAWPTHNPDSAQATTPPAQEQ